MGLIPIGNEQMAFSTSWMTMSLKSEHEKSLKYPKTDFHVTNRSAIGFPNPCIGQTDHSLNKISSP
jgi:hypothetical protein